MLSTKEKSVQINIHSDYYGTVAEIGGGQETVRHLFQAGGASNSIAKSISAYDKLFSDHFYNNGVPGRYVAEERLRKMIHYEYQELISLLQHKTEQKFFAFANTVEVLNFRKTNLGKGWIGIAFEGSNRHEPNLLLCHIKLHENDTLLQQYSVGTIGINLIHGALFESKDPRKILTGLMDNLDTQRIEVDYVKIEGPDYQEVDNRLLNLMLVQHNMTPVILFDHEGKVQHAGDMLYKKNVLLMRGHFRPINNLGIAFLEDSLETFKKDEDYTAQNTMAFCEISLNYLIKDQAIDETDFLDRVDILNMTGVNVIVSKFNRYFELINFFGQYKLIKLRLVIGLPTFLKLFDQSYYTDMRGRLLEALGAMFQDNVKVYLYPKYNQETASIEEINESHFDSKTVLLWRYLNENGSVLKLKGISSEILHIRSEKISEMIEEANPALQKYLPEAIYKHIVDNKLFGYGTKKTPRQNNLGDIKV